MELLAIDGDGAEEAIASVDLSARLERRATLRDRGCVRALEPVAPATSGPCRAAAGARAHRWRLAVEGDEAARLSAPFAPRWGIGSAWGEARFPDPGGAGETVVAQVCYREALDGARSFSVF